MKVSFACAALALALSGAGCTRAKEARPNVLLVTLDTTRADALGCYGKPGDPTPALDAIAREGTRFDLAISTASLTPVSHASILTGLDNAQHGVRVLAGGSGMKLSSEHPTLATVLEEHGYRTAAVLSAFPVSAAYGFDRGFDLFDCPEGALETGPAGNPTWNLSRHQRRADATTDKALEWVRGGEDPFLLWVHYFDPHDAVLFPPADALPPGISSPARGTVDLTRELYDVEVRYMDRQIGRLVDWLRESGAWENTLVVVVGDHGEGLGDHDWHHHRILYQEQICVPMIVRVPDVANRSATVSTLARTTDLFPTLLDCLGIQAPGELDGLSLRGAMEGRAEAPRVALADAINGYDPNAMQIRSRPLDEFLYCAMDSRWKLVYRPAHPEASELFDLATDPRELENLYAKDPARARGLEAELCRRQPWVVAPFAPLDPSVAEKTRESLSDLGYAGEEDPANGPAWAWTCVEHREWKSEIRKSCTQCGSPPLLVAR